MIIILSSFINDRCRLLILTALTVCILLPAGLHAQQSIVISGKVTDKTGETLPGVNIFVEGGRYGTTTGNDGNWSITVPGKSTVLVFSLMGYLARRITAGEAASKTVVLNEDVQMLEDIVVVGYGTQRKITTTGAITSVSNSDLVKAPVAGISNALTGLTSGLQSVQVSGEFGNDKADIRIRGISTLYTGGAAPLIMVDGVERTTYNDIDPNEIETLNVLKDASATAVFGVRGANGVILITTRQGKAGKPRVNFTGNSAVIQPSILPRMLNSYDYALLRNEAERNMGRTETFSEEDILLYKSGEDPVFHPDKNWIDELIKPVSFQQSYNVNISGGSERMSYFTSLGYFNQSGGYNEPEQDLGFSGKHKYDRYNLRMNFDFDVTKDLIFSVKLGNQITNNMYPTGGAWAAFDKSTSTSPMSSPGFIDGKVITDVSGFPAGVREFNPWVETGPTSGGSLGLTEKYYSNTINTNLSVKYKMDGLVKGLSARVMGAYDTYYNKYSKRQKYFDTYTVIKNPADGQPTVFRNDEKGPFYGLSENIADDRKWRKMYGEAALEYDAVPAEHHKVSGLILGNMQKAYYPNMQYKLPTAYLGIAGRVTYNYGNRYLAEMNVGYNGSENFPEGKRFGFFPAFSLGWVVTEESFLPDNDILSFLKIRGSYGEVGNDKIGGNRYLYLDGPYTLGNDGNARTTFGIPGINQATYQQYKEGRIGNPDVTWERAKKGNIGFDMTLFNNRLNFTADYFGEKRDNILWNLSTIPELVAASLPPGNIGKVDNYGYELEAGWKDRSGELTYWMKALYSFARNNIVFQDEPEREYEWMRRTGKPVGQHFGLIFEGFYNTMDEINDPERPVSLWEGGGLKPGDMKYRDLNNDKRITEEDMCPIGYSDFPEINYSFSFGASWNGFDFSLLFQGASNVSVYFSKNAGAYPFDSDWGAAYEWQLERWEQGRYERGETISYPRVELSPALGGNNYQKSTFWVQDASYLRLKNAEAGYRFKSSLLQKANLQSLRIYVSGNNLCTWTGIKYPMDPDAREAYGRVMPPMRVFNFGLNFQF
ncbi:MAG: TonB-dependent receptor [Bacteroidales bacterium]|jgi:TonB-linked SusC/RagA family outer membrane protein|nr:TonB-dependent receptor [Bacteroidales bacterium]